MTQHAWFGSDPWVGTGLAARLRLVGDQPDGTELDPVDPLIFPLSYWDLDASGRIVQMSATVEAHLGWSPREVYGRFCTSFIAYPERDRANELFLGVATSLGDWSDEVFTFICKGGALRRMLSSGAARVDQHGLFAGFAGAIRPLPE